MKRACIAVVDAARARLYTYREDEKDVARQLEEVKDLVNPGRRLRPSEMFSETRPALGQSGKPGGSHEPGSTKDDHRDDHIAMMDAKFAKEVVAEIDHILQTGFAHVILIASPKMLGELRKADGVFKRPGIVIEEVQSDLAKLTQSQLHDHLASLDLIPPRQRLVVAR